MSRTTVLISNLHCSSCVRTIEEALSSLSPPPTSVNVSVVSQSVTVEHSTVISQADLHAILEDAGFDISLPSENSTEDYPSRRRTISGVSTFLSGKRRKHVQQCSLCQAGDTTSPRNVASTSERKNVGSTCSFTEDHGSAADTSGAFISKKKASISPSSSHASLDVSPNDGACRLTLSIGGMTCSACSGTITEMISQLPGVSEVAVSLLSNSATVVVSRQDLTSTIMETIDDCGFEGELIKTEPLFSSGSEVTTVGPRTISLRVDGMFCQHCPSRILDSLAKLAPQVSVVKAFTNHTDPVIELSYEPSPPDMTIRSIISTITSVDPKFHVSIYRPPSLELRTRSMQLREQRNLLRRLLFTVIVAIPTFIIGVVYMSLVSSGNQVKQYLMEPMWHGDASRVQWALFFLATPVMFYSAGLFHRRSMKEIKALWRKGSTTPIVKRFTRFGSMNLLVSTGVSVAYFSSIALLALAASEPPSPMGVGQDTTYFDSVVFLTMFLLAGRFLEAYSKARTADAITALGSLRPSDALLVSPRSSVDTSTEMPSLSGANADPEKGNPASDNGALAVQPGFKIVKVNVDFLEVGDVVRVQNGATPPADGTILSGAETAFDESSLTGESRLIKKHIGDQVYLGTINKSAAVDVRVDAIGGVTMLDHIVKIVREGQTRRAPIERVADLITGFFVPVVTLLAVITWVVWLGLGLGGAISQDYLDISIGGWTVWSLEFAIAVFVVACPCGIGLAAPTALLVGSGLAAKHGILARGGGEAFQEMAQLDVVVFDKTGTLTEGGQPQVCDAEITASTSRWKRETVLGIAAELESASSHPLGTAIKHYSEAHGASSANGSEFDEVAGRGVRARFEDLQCVAIIGNEAWLSEHGVSIGADVASYLERWKTEAKSVILLAIAESAENSPFTIAAIFAVSDPLRPEAKAVVRCLRDNGIESWMISGDNEVTARAVAQMVGIPAGNVIAGVLPHQKAEKILWLQQNGAKRPPSRWQRLFGKQRLNERCIVAMVGDGINDAPALAAGDIGIAIGSGSDVALSSASFILLSSNLQSLLTLSDLSQKVFTRVKLNFLWAVVYNLIALPVAAGVIYPAGHARLAPVWASLAMALSSVSVVCSSLLLKLYREPKAQK
ncbi:heavy metal translocatin [Leucogyrophana mollusca]|uniref:Heavy metal translocatin n=1 Tax=Leucogyrophana mollusca TaxID=85980 RepID=A0ACB8BVE9_9AGAM|nr:heavy metal translocatin [Leucogyrophana mollusca]